MAEAPSHSSAFVRGLVQLFAAQGVDSGWLLRESGVDAERLRHSHERFVLPDVDRLWELAIVHSGRPALGLDRALARRHPLFDIAEQTMWSSPDLASALEALSQYLRLIGDASGFSLVSERGDRWLVLDHAAGEATIRQRVEFTMFATLLLCQRATRRELRPLIAEFAFPEPAEYHPYRMSFHCPLRFGQPTNRMRLSREDLTLPVIGEGESIFAIQDQVIAARLARSARDLTAYRAAGEMIRKLHLGEPRRESVARNLGLTDQVLEQRLRSESGTSFDELLDDVRRELAHEYLRQPGHSPAQVAALLGWDNVSPLTAACKRWFGANVSDFRQGGSPVPRPTALGRK